MPRSGFCGFSFSQIIFNIHHRVGLMMGLLCSNWALLILTYQSIRATASSTFNGDQHSDEKARFAEPRREKSLQFLFISKYSAEMNWVQRKIYLYNVTFGLYMLDWWERFLFNTLVLVLMWFVCYNGTRYATEVWKRYVG